MSNTYVKIFEDREYSRILYAGTNKQIAKDLIIGNIDSTNYNGHTHTSHTLQTWKDGEVLEEEYTNIDGKDYEVS